MRLTYLTAFISISFVSGKKTKRRETEGISVVIHEVGEIMIKRPPNLVVSSDAFDVLQCVWRY